MNEEKKPQRPIDMLATVILKLALYVFYFVLAWSLFKLVVILFVSLK